MLQGNYFVGMAKGGEFNLLLEAKNRGRTILMLGRLCGVGRLNVGEVHLVALNLGLDLPLCGGLLGF